MIDTYLYLSLLVLLNLYISHAYLDIMCDITSHQVYYKDESQIIHRVPSHKVLSSYGLNWNDVAYVAPNVLTGFTQGEPFRDISEPKQISLISHPSLIAYKDPSLIELPHDIAYGSQTSLSLWVWLWELPEGKGDYGILHANPSNAGTSLAPAIILSSRSEDMQHPYFCIFNGRDRVHGVTSLHPILLRQWVHIAMTISDTTVSGYIDGHFAGSFLLPNDGGNTYNDIYTPPAPSVMYIGRSSLMYGASGFISNLFYFDNYLLDEEGVQSLAERDLRPYDFDNEMIKLAGVNSSYLFEMAVNRSYTFPAWKDKTLTKLNEIESDSNNEIDPEEYFEEMSEFEYQRYMYLLSALPLTSMQELELLTVHNVTEKEIEMLKVSNYGALLALGNTQYYGAPSKSWVPGDISEDFIKSYLWSNGSWDDVVIISKDKMNLSVDIDINGEISEVLKDMAHQARGLGSGNFDEELIFLEEEIKKIDYEELHGPLVDEIPTNCPVALSYYSLTAYKAYDLFDETGTSTSLVEDVRIWNPQESLDGHKGESSDIVQFQIQAAERGDHNAQMWVGQQMYWGRHGMNRDQPRAMEYFNAAAEGGLPVAQYNLGVMRLHGGGGMEPNREEAMRLFSLAADQGYAPAQNGLGIQYMDGASKNLTRAFELFKMAADGGSTDAMINVANIYKVGKTALGGEGPERDVKKALYYFGLASLDNHSSALYMLGVSYRDRTSWIGKIDSKEDIIVENEKKTLTLPLRYDCNTAIYFLKKVSELAILSEHVSKGLEAYVKHGDMMKSLYHYSIAAEIGYVTAASNAAWIHNQLSLSYLIGSEERNIHMSNSLKRYIQCSQQHDADGLVNAGDAYYYGISVEPNKVTAALFYLEGVDEGNARSAFNLGYMSYVEEGGLTRNESIAFLDIAENMTSGLEVIAIWSLKLVVTFSPLDLVKSISIEDWLILVIFIITIFISSIIMYRSRQATSENI